MMHCNYTRVFLSSLMYYCYCRFLPRFLTVFSLSWQKYFLPWQKPNPVTKKIRMGKKYKQCNTSKKITLEPVEVTLEKSTGEILEVRKGGYRDEKC